MLIIGIIGAIIILIGDMLMGWGIKDMTKSGIELQISPYLKLSNTRMIIASICGFSGVPFACIGHFGIYKSLKPYSTKYARAYMIGILGFLAFGGAGVHVSKFYSFYYTVSEPLTNALAVGAFSLGNIWCLVGHLILLKRIEEK